MLTDIRFVREALRAGASGYVPKKSTASELVTAIRAVARGETYISPSVAGALKDDYLGAISERDPGPLSALTPREREVLQLLAEGKVAKQIGSELGVSVKTVSVHRRHIMAKLEIDSLADLVKFAIRTGLISLDN
jgi:DNA-binding NarL/FixJ family response regulator